MNDTRNITKGRVSKVEAAFLAKAGVHPTFSLALARQWLGHAKHDPTPQFLGRLQRKGWIRHIRRGRYAVIPLSSGEDRSPQLHEFVVAMELVSPAVIAYWSALNHHGMTEQLPRTVFVATDHPVRRQPGEVLGVKYRIVSLKPAKLFGVTKEWIDEVPFYITDREKTIIDGLDIPRNVGGVSEIAKALSSSWKLLDERKLRQYAVKIGNSAVAKRLGFIMETLGLGDVAAFRAEVPRASGFSALDPNLPKSGKFSRRWGLHANAEVQP